MGDIIMHKRVMFKYIGILSQTLLCISIMLCLRSSMIVAAAANENAKVNATDADRVALLAFKQGITADPLNIMSSWNNAIHYCGWTGVSCGKRHPGRVTALKLNGTKLAGQLPPDIGNLSFLRLINLYSNSFTGEIPQEMGYLTRLTQLYLDDNQFQGEIPSNLSLCSDLQELYLSKNNLVGYIPSEIGRLSKLQFLALQSNNLSGTIPPSLYNLSSLLQLSLANNHFQGRLAPDIAFRFPNLLGLYLGNNQFTGPIPVSLPNATGLQMIVLTSNSFTGTVPTNLGGLTNLIGLGLGDNQLETEKPPHAFSFLTSLTNCSNLNGFEISVNRFSGELPPSLSNFSFKLQQFSVEGNHISGSIPEGIGKLIGLLRFSFASNKLSGNIPVGIGNLENLQQFDMSGNQISGEIPSSIGNITSLSQLYLGENYLYGNIPSGLGSCTQLELLELYSNNLTGTIPLEVASLASMTLSLDLSQNSLTGHLPEQLGNMSKLVDLDVSQNKLSGEIPSTISKCLMLTSLLMGNNLLEGSIPSSLSRLTSLNTLNFSRNNISGKFPTYLQNITSLENLDLSYNNLEGEVPHEGIFSNTSKFAIIGNMKLCGGTKSLSLPACPSEVSKTHRGHIDLRVALPVSISCFLLLTCLLFSLWKMRKTGRKTPDKMATMEKFQKVSYLELSKATNEFSSSNLIGQGSYGCVYKGTWGIDNEMIVAVKVLNLKRKGAAKSFTAECNALRNIRHRNLIRVITSCSSIDSKGADFKALVFEFMPNGSLEKFLHSNIDEEVNQGNLSLTQRLGVASDIASALEYLHYRCGTSIVHGDLKPSNVLLDHDMTAHVGDFGLAKILYETVSDNSFANQTNSSTDVRGTVGYVAPEYGTGGKASMQGDVYSFGILLLEMFTGKSPTNDIFTDDCNLHIFTKEALPERVTKIVDPFLLSEYRRDNADVNIVEDCLAAVLNIGVSCSMESPAERMDIRQVVAEISKLKLKICSLTTEINLCVV